MNTTDPFTEAAREKAADKWHDTATGRVRQIDFVAGAEWARSYLAAQEPSHEEVIAATKELYVRSHHSTGRQVPFERLDHEEQVAWVVDGRAVLEAARRARGGTT